MLPHFSINDIADRGAVDPKSRADGGLSHRRVQTANLPDIIIGQLSKARIGPVRRSRDAAPFSDHISHVVGLVAAENMLRIDAGSIIASMKTSGHRPVSVGHLKGQSMRIYSPTLEPNISVSQAILSERPVETFVSCVSSDSFYEPVVISSDVLVGHGQVYQTTEAWQA